MKIAPIKAHRQEFVTMEGARGARMRMLIGPEERAPHFFMRHFELDPGGCTPHHQHDYEHEVLILKGSGTAMAVSGPRPFNAGDVIYIAANELHQFQNTGTQPCEFICLIPAPRQKSCGC